MDGLVPSLLVFGVLPTYPLSNLQLPGQVQRLRAMMDARAEMGRIVAEQRITRALRSKMPPAVKYDLNPGMSVLVYREDKRRWHRPYKIDRIDDKRVFITDVKFSRPFSITQILPYAAKQRDLELHWLLSGLKYLRSCPQIAITEVFHPSDQKAKHSKCYEAMAREIAGLLQRGVFEIVDRGDLPHDANIIRSRTVLDVKAIGTDGENYKAKLVIHGHKDHEKGSLLHNSPSILRPTLRLMMTTAAIRQYRQWSLGITQVFLQSTDINLPVYLRPPVEFGLKHNELFKLVNPLYGIVDAGDYLYWTLWTSICEDLGLPNANGDVSLYLGLIDDIWHGLLAVYVDDLCAAGGPFFEQLRRKTETRFESRDRLYGHFHFAGIQISQQDDGSIYMNQELHAALLEILPEDCPFEEFPSRRHSLAWLSCSHPDFCATTNILSQITKDNFQPTHVEAPNNVINHVQETPSQGLTFHALDEDSLLMLLFSDIIFANFPENSTQLGYIILLTDHTGRANVLHFSSYKSKRVVRSVLHGETHAFADGFDMAFTLSHYLTRILQRDFPLTMLSNSMSLFRFMLNSSVTTEKSLLIDIAAARETRSLRAKRYTARRVDTHRAQHREWPHKSRLVRSAQSISQQPALKHRDKHRH